jgi:hypothetical protein
MRQGRKACDASERSAKNIWKKRSAGEESAIARREGRGMYILQR